MLRVPSSLGESQERLVTQVIDCGFHVHSVLGPGFKERIYVQAFRLELHSRGLSFESEKSIDVRYKEWTIPGQRVDLVIGGLVIVEIKAVPNSRRFTGSRCSRTLRR